MHNICLLPSDGIGPEVIACAEQALRLDSPPTNDSERHYLIRLSKKSISLPPPCLVL